MHSQNEEQPPSRLAVFGAVTFYLVAALAMIIANKWVLLTSSTPLFFLFCQFIVAIALLLCCRALRLLKFSVVPNLATIQGLAPLVIVNVLGLSFNNYTLKLVDASYYQVARGMLVPFTVVTSYYFLDSRPSLRILGACTVVTSGFLVGVLLDTSYSSTTATASPLGILFGLISTLTTSLHAVVIKQSLEVVKGDTMEMAWYSNLLSSILLLPVIFAVGEVPHIFELFSLEDLDTVAGQWTTWQTFVWGTIITGVLGFLICIAGFLSIKVTSPVTHMISSAVRGVFQSLLGMWLFHDIITSGRASSIAIILIGSIFYSYIKNEEAIAKARQAAARGASYARVPMTELEEGRKSTPQD